MSLRKTFKTDRTADVNGAWVKVGFNERTNKPQEILIARAARTNPEFTKVMEEVYAPYQEDLASGTLSDALKTKLSIEVFTKAIIKDWREIDKSELTGNDEDGEPLEFTIENVLALFEELPDVFPDWENKSNNMSNFRQKELQAKRKN